MHFVKSNYKKWK